MEGLVCRVAEAQLVRWLSIAGLPSPCLFTHLKSPMSKSATKSYNSLFLSLLEVVFDFSENQLMCKMGDENT